MPVEHEYRITVGMLADDGTHHIAAWERPDGDVAACYVTRVVGEARHVHRQLSDGLHPPPIGCDLHGYRSVIVSAVQVYRRDGSGRWFHLADMNGYPETPSPFRQQRLDNAGT